jgi:hypothetical protein
LIVATGHAGQDDAVVARAAVDGHDIEVGSLEVAPAAR